MYGGIHGYYYILGAILSAWHLTGALLRLRSTIIIKIYTRRIIYVHKSTYTHLIMRWKITQSPASIKVLRKGKKKTSLIFYHLNIHIAITLCWCQNSYNPRASIWEVLASISHSERGMREYGCWLGSPCRMQIEGNTVMFQRLFLYHWFCLII